MISLGYGVIKAMGLKIEADFATGWQLHACKRTRQGSLLKISQYLRWSPVSAG
jgi:hypothetical protein